MERTAIEPHVSWSGPQPDREIDAYLLAMLVRVYSAGLDNDEEDRDVLAHPSVFTVKSLPMVATMYAYYKHEMEERNIHNNESMLKLIRDSMEEDFDKWLPGSKAEVKKAEAYLIDFVDTAENPGFSVFG